MKGLYTMKRLTEEEESRMTTRRERREERGAKRDPGISVENWSQGYQDKT